MNILYEFNFKNGTTGFIRFTDELSHTRLVEIEGTIISGLRSKDFITLTNGTDDLSFDCAEVVSYTKSRWVSNET